MPVRRSHTYEFKDELRVGQRSQRKAAHQRKRRRQRLIIGAIVLCLATVLGAGLCWMHRSNKLARAVVQRNTTETASASTAAARPSTAPAPEPMPTPVVASFKGVALHLSVSLKDLTEVGFHPASYSYAMPLDTSLVATDTGAVAAAKGTGRDKSKQPAGPAAALIGFSIQMWRTDAGSYEGRSAIDEGAPAGSTTYAPIDGTITAVRYYNYENGCKDYEVHISFDSPELARYEIVMIHEDKVRVKVGDKVIAGVTPIAQVRDLTPYLDNQLSVFTGEAGNHAHIQVNDTKSQSYLDVQKQRATSSFYIN